MTTPQTIRFSEIDLDAIATAKGRVAVIVTPDGKLDQGARRANRLTKGAVARLAESEKWAKAKPGQVITLAMPAGMAAEALDVVCLPRRPSVDEARRAGVALAKAQDGAALTVLAGSSGRVEHLALGLALRAYDFADHRTGKDAPVPSDATIMTAKPDEVETAAAPLLAVADGVFFTRDLVNEPANILTTTEFADRLSAMESLGLKVEVLEEADLEKLGMGSFLSVGQGSDSPTKLVVMRWEGGEKGDAPLALVGKGVVFDTGGISLKPAAGMEDMTMDMGGAGVVAGVMRALAKRKAAANVVGLVGLVENMPSGTATRPGDVVKSMKGDTIEVINTDAEGRLVLADVMWYAQETFKPRGMIDLATLTGACIIALGHENAAVFSNDDKLAGQFLKAAEAEGEGAWRMPLGQAYDDMLKSPIADMKNVGGRPAGSITAAQFLQRFVQEGCPWIHLDIAGVARVQSETTYAPKGATGWGVLALNRLIADTLEG
ncbi:leucyl aminopeptidase [Lutimaribacter sp. EGI FJ00015]|uniref:Leucyl aminopeptidase n=1 Tax=Lutimaribacter degradans TaxID=2945989 RepID=A0ACC5ZST8_9RHOB|nr:leucyl aminopeptidase [Lutimaribacter sp. EGI FJ00013]MCM2561210.1 leucyl aminopeptidase [Lutimaribacter sp. EGI FJ00013]MCO0611841.1 leucyl aminopeptidase [Lutimaribacter sp. EGI FJ00015]MCO0635038.1 leucyl aminopeptidase [Lutimaribacter sp. EGI FJ00014]